jgi:adenine/guanine phosphoribosyltransferase-like PRPP-binding protein
MAERDVARAAHSLQRHRPCLIIDDMISTGGAI